MISPMCNIKEATHQAMKTAFDDYKGRAERILAGTWDEAELDQGILEYANKARQASTPIWVDAKEAVRK
jgi:hypothetical protein